MFTAETDMARMTLHPSGVAVVVEKAGARHDDATVRTDLLTFRALTGEQPVAVVWDVRRMSRPRPEGLAAFLRRIPFVASGVALLVDADSPPVIEAVPPVMSTLHYPMRIFDDYDRAYEWVRQFAPAEFSVDHLESEG